MTQAESPRSDAERAAAKRAEEAYVRGLIERGEAAWPVNGELPPGATHEIVEERPGELPKIRRRRFA
ncbi:MAG TPA: hypothetical protein VH834_06460 [Solirubrobacteraceae bacterium]|jgi:hypothetical protein